MKITKCETCLKKYHGLYGLCPHFEIISLSFIQINKSFCSIDIAKKGNTQHSIPKEWINYDFPCKFFVSKPKTEEAFL